MQVALVLCIGLRVAVVYSADLPKYVRKSYNKHTLYEIKGNSELKDDLLEKFAINDDSLLLEHNTVLVSPAIREQFEQALKKYQLEAKVIVEDIQSYLDKETEQTIRNKGFGWTSYYGVDDINGYLQNMSQLYPDSVSVVEGGRSYHGRKILGLRINTPATDNEQKPVVIIESGIHAREWIAPATTTYFINELLTSQDSDIAAMRDHVDWHIFPTINPDGYEFTRKYDRYWRKTLSPNRGGCWGTDPNRNWDHNWGVIGASNNPCRETYRGSKAFSEIETRTFADYIKNVDNLAAYVAFHSYAQMLLVPLSDSTEHLENYDDIVTIGNKSLEYGYAVHKSKYEGPGTAASILYPCSGGSMDWVRSALNVPLAYTYELRGIGFTWPPDRIHEQGDEVTQMMLGFFTEAVNLGYL